MKWDWEAVFAADVSPLVLWDEPRHASEQVENVVIEWKAKGDGRRAAVCV